jgi:hypothetical protein
MTLPPSAYQTANTQEGMGMNRQLRRSALLVAALCGMASGQITPGKYGRGGTIDRKGVLPAHIANSEGVAHGGEFRDLILPLPARAQREKPLWGIKETRARDAWYGIEDDEYSYWGGNPILGNDGKHHCFVARWPEDAEKGHFHWPRSTVAHAIAVDPLGPWKVLGEAYPYLNGGKGHNPEVRRLANGRWGLWLNGGAVLATEGKDINGKWVSLGRTTVSPEWHPMTRQHANPSLTNVRKDGSLVFCTRAGSIGIIPDGNPVSPIEGIQPRAYPAYGGGPEDPVIWKTAHQYHLLYNYWMLRLAVKLRSHDGVHWELDPGIAYTEVIEKYTDGTVVPWYKVERPKIVQDAHGRATHLAVAVIDVVKTADLGDDNHSSKHITFPLVVEGLTEILNADPITEATSKVEVKLKAEAGFDALRDVDVDSLRFGDPKEVDFGRGMKATETKPDGKDLLVTFKGAGSGITADSFTGKILGRRTDGGVYYAYPRLPGFVDDPAVLVASPFRRQEEAGKVTIRLVVKNFGLERSRPATLRATDARTGQVAFSVPVPPLEPYGQKGFSVEAPRKHDAKTMDQQLKRIFTPKYHTRQSTAH